MDKQNRH